LNYDDSTQPGRHVVPPSRTLVTDILHFHREIPTCAQDRLIQLTDLDHIRRSLNTRISWPVLFLKAYSSISQRNPQLRQTWRNWPWPHLYQHASPCGSLAVTRRFRGEDWLFWGRFRNPQNLSLESLQVSLDRLQTEEVEHLFRRQLQLSALITPIRRLVWWWNLNLAGEKRGTRLGTFALTTVSGRGAEIQHPPGVMTSVLTFGPIHNDGCSRVTVAYDHRLMDGAFVAERLEELESELSGQVREELLALTGGSGSEAA